MKLDDLKKKEEPREVTVYNYLSDGKVCTTPNVEIAIARRQGDAHIQVEKHLGEQINHSTLVID